MDARYRARYTPLGWALGIALICVALASPAGVSPPPPRQTTPPDASPVSTTLPGHGVRLGAWSLRFEATRLAEVVAALGVGAIQHQGEAGEALAWLCYDLPEARLWLLSSEMGGAEAVLTGAVLQAGDALADGCPPLPGRLQPVALTGGLTLGDSDDAIERGLGTPAWRDAIGRHYLSMTKEPGFCAPEGADRLQWLTLRLQRGRIRVISAGQVTSC